MRARRDVRLDMLEPTFKECCERHLRRFDISPTLHFGDQSGALAVGFALRTFEAVPFAAALAGRVFHVEDDGPVAWRSFADMALHYCSPSSSFSDKGEALSAISPRSALAIP